MHLVRISKVMGCLVSGRVGWDRWMPLIKREVCELFISGEGAPWINL